MFIGDLYFQGKYNKCLWPLLEDIQSHGEPQDCEKKKCSLCCGSALAYNFNTK